MVRWLLKWSVFDVLGALAISAGLLGAMARWWDWPPALLGLGAALAMKLAPSPLTNGTQPQGPPPPS